MNRESKIYTRTGDRGLTTSGGSRVCKADDLPEALGEIDELNSWLGVLAEGERSGRDDTESLGRIQRTLTRICFQLNGTGDDDGEDDFDAETGWLESEIDTMTETLPELDEFILPRGCTHVARAVCRRAERRVAGFLLGTGTDSVAGTDSAALRFLNRLSDYLFVLARVRRQPDDLFPNDDAGPLRTGCERPRK